MDSADIPQPHQTEVLKSTKTEIEQIGERVLKSLKEQPLTPKAEEADSF